MKETPLRPLVLLVYLILLCWTNASGQSYQLVNSGEVLKRAKVLSDSGKFDLAIKELLTVPNADTNYFPKQRALVDAYLNNRDYDKAIALANYMSTIPTNARAHYLWAKANALEKKEKYDEAIELIKQALNEYPFDGGLRYRLAATYHNKGDYKNAIAAYFKVLEIAPFQSSSHLNLGRISIFQGQKVHAMLSLGIYLALEPDDNPRLKLLDNFVSNSLEEDGKQKATEENAFEEIDFAIRAEIAMNKKFKSKIPVDAPVVKQMELLFQQLEQKSISGDEDPWVKQYLPIFKKLLEAKQSEAFIYHILSSAKIDAVTKWKEKNKKEMEAMFNSVNTVSKELRATIPVPESLGLGATASAGYEKDHTLDGIGKMVDGKRQGEWIFYHSNGVVAARGKFENGVKKGVWKYFRDDASLKSEENEDNGLILIFNSKGQNTLRYTLVEKKAQGNVEFYFRSGPLSERLTYKDGKREGAGTAYFADGRVFRTYQYQEDLATGTWTTYFFTGAPSVVENFVAGKLEGPFQVFWINKKVKQKGSYKNDELDGEWTSWHQNGRIEKQGTYLEGKKIGVWKEYDSRGQLVETISYNQDGDEDGETVRYVFGKVANKILFAKGDVKQLIYYDESGKELAKFGNESGTFSSKKFRATGSLYAEGEYKDGSRSGTWTGYFPSGIKRSEYTFRDEKMEGPETNYNAFGGKTAITNRKNGELDGLYQEFYVNGRVKTEGWYVEGEREQEWRGFYPDGTISWRSYYLNGSIRDTARNYAVSGKLASFEIYDDGRSIYEEAYGSRVPVRYRISGAVAASNDTLRFPDGKLYATYQTVNGVVNGTTSYFYPDGSIFTTSQGRMGWVHGRSAVRLPNGVTISEGESVLSEREGVWRFSSPNGKPHGIGSYFEGQLDSVYVSYYAAGTKRNEQGYLKGSQHGPAKTFGPDGTLLVEWFAESGEQVRYRSRGKNGQMGPWTNVTPEFQLVAYYNNGSKGLEQTFKDGFLDGTSRIYYPDGKLCEEYVFKNYDYSGLHTAYYPNGKLCRRVNFVDDLEEGVEEWFNADGTPIRKAIFHLGVLHGPCTYYGKDGKANEVIFYNGFLD